MSEARQEKKGGGERSLKTSSATKSVKRQVLEAGFLSGARSHGRRNSKRVPAWQDTLCLYSLQFKG